MTIAYFDCFAGVSGDMSLGALVDAGVDIEDIRRELKKMPLGGYRIASKKVIRCGISATKVDVSLEKAGSRKPDARTWKDIGQIIKRSRFPDHLKGKGLAIFKRLFEAEAKVHGESPGTVHLHELGAVDCMVDIFGTLIGLDLLGVHRVYTSSINLGTGTVKSTHGTLPVPAPASAELLKGYAVYSSEIPFELTTPTGAAIVSGLASASSPVPPMRVDRIGYGAGNKDIKTMPNTLRILVGKEIDEGHPLKSGDEVVVIEANIDDMSPQFYETAIERLFDAGALDVFLENIIMKKGRPAIKLTVIAQEKGLDRLADTIFHETTTIGLRFYRAERKTLDREIKKIKTRLGEVRVKVSRLRGDVMTSTLEYDDVKALSKKHRLPERRIIEEVSKSDCND